jgi:hypothetical protein
MIRRVELMVVVCRSVLVVHTLGSAGSVPMLSIHLECHGVLENPEYGQVGGQPSGDHKLHRHGAPKLAIFLTFVQHRHGSRGDMKVCYQPLDLLQSLLDACTQKAKTQTHVHCVFHLRQCFHSVFQLVRRCFHCVFQLVRHCFHSVFHLQRHSIHCVFHLVPHSFDCVFDLERHCFHCVFHLERHCFHHVSQLVRHCFHCIFQLVRHGFHCIFQLVRHCSRSRFSMCTSLF